MSTTPSKKIVTFKNPEPRRNYTITCECGEFTCLCPMTGQPDFANITISYVPSKLCVELKSLKLYLWSFRNEGAFHEAVTNKILNDLVKTCRPRWMQVSCQFNIRGGIDTTVVATHGKYPKTA